MQIQTDWKEIFADRHIGPRESETAAMLREVGAESLEGMMEAIVPNSIRRKREMRLPAAATEAEFLKEIRALAGLNRPGQWFIGMGYYGCHTPGVISRNILENPGWYTQYTPYQAEISQGRLEALLNYQTLVSDLTGLPVANASLLDEATAAAEAMVMLHSITRRNPGKKDSHTFWVSRNCHPQTCDVLAGRAAPLGIELQFGDEQNPNWHDGIFSALIQYPDTHGVIPNLEAFCRSAASKDILTVVATDLLALTMLQPPSEFGAAVAIGSSQRLGVPMGFGGPHAAFFSTREEFKRHIPGRIIGVSVDRDGHAALRMALQTREQHIRREKATSNICTAQVLLAIMSGMYAVYHGPGGLQAIARRTHGLTRLLAQGLELLGYAQMNPMYFDTLRIDAKGCGDAIRRLAENASMHFRYFENGDIGISFDETTCEDDVRRILHLFAQAATKEAPSQKELAELRQRLRMDWPASLTRSSGFLNHPVFNSHHSETRMLRYIRKLEKKDLSLAQSMIPLGSCTMKLNATTEMLPVTWSEFADIHPFAPEKATEGYGGLIRGLEEALTEITGLEATSLQPNAGSQGEYAGLMVIRAYHRDRGEAHRNVVLIPASAHGTNPASAALAGLRVVVTACDANGNVDIPDLEAKAREHADNLSALMITYPSTHGVFETGVRKICDIIHNHGGQVYMDGANMNAQVGYCDPGTIGADVCHLNLHKTFCIPHGGGGPGMGPISVAAHLAPYLPGHPNRKTGGSKPISAISAAPWGSPGILPISWAYIRMMGAEGLRRATAMAILNANYIRKRLETHYPILYTGVGGWVAHELILDCRAFKQSAEIEVEDIAKRLMDYGYHAPTVSFPVAGTLMIEPTESEDKQELDLFCEAMISIRMEIAEVETGIAPRKNNALKNAPHTLGKISSDAWDYPYSREKAAFPLEWVRNNKFWPAAARLDNAYGDRNLVCSCPPIAEYVNT